MPRHAMLCHVLPCHNLCWHALLEALKPCVWQAAGAEVNVANADGKTAL